MDIFDCGGSKIYLLKTLVLEIDAFRLKLLYIFPILEDLLSMFGILLLEFDGLLLQLTYSMQG